MINCKGSSIEDATHFYGPKIPHKGIDEHLYYPELFRTSFTSIDEKPNSGMGFEPNAVSEWFAFFSKKDGSWLASNANKHNLVTVKRAKPGSWEKYKLERYEKGGHVVWGIKSAHNRYVVCESNKEANANRTWHRAWEEMKLFSVGTGKMVIYSQYWGRYLRIVGGNVKCDTEDPSQATIWTVPTAL